MAPAPSLACASPHHEQQGLHTTIETLLDDCDSNFMASSVVPTLLREIWAVHKNLRTRNRKAVSQK
jgi:hypothetical protein